jgi:hypothetical protein
MIFFYSLLFHFPLFFSFFSKAELTSFSLFLTEKALGMYGTYGETLSLTFGLLCKSQVCNIGVSFLSVFHYQRSLRYVVDVALMLLVFLNVYKMNLQAYEITVIAFT